MENISNRHVELGHFLRKKREKLSPETVGIKTYSRRRTPGLRREEVALLASIGLSWYTWLEQGKPISISYQSLKKIARALRLNQQEVRYVFSLANLVVPKENPRSDYIIESVANVINNLSFSPAFVLDQCFNIVLWNKALTLLFPDIELIPPEKCNLLTICFTSDAFRKMCVNWEDVCREILAKFRVSHGKYIGDPNFNRVIKYLRKKSSFFEQLWNEHYIAPEENMTKVFIHSELGALTFEHTAFTLAGNENTHLKMYIETPIPGSDSEAKIKKQLME